MSFFRRDFNEKKVRKAVSTEVDISDIQKFSVHIMGVLVPATEKLPVVADEKKDVSALLLSVLKKLNAEGDESKTKSVAKGLYDLLLYWDETKDNDNCFSPAQNQIVLEKLLVIDAVFRRPSAQKSPPKEVKEQHKQKEDETKRSKKQEGHEKSEGHPPRSSPPGAGRR